MKSPMIQQFVINQPILEMKKLCIAIKPINMNEWMMTSFILLGNPFKYKKAFKLAENGCLETYIIQNATKNVKYFLTE